MNLDTHSIPRCDFHPPFSKNVLLPLLLVLLFCRPLLICILHRPTPHPPRLIVLERCSATLVRRTSSYVYKRTLIYPLSFHIFPISHIFVDCRNLCLHFVSVISPRPSTYFPPSLILAQYQVVTVPFSSGTFQIQTVCSIFRSPVVLHMRTT